MKLSEKIGYTLEHLLEIELRRRKIEVEKNEKPGNETIRSDITFSRNGKRFVVFVTHTKTQGMTNRKFYRTFEELAQRRMLTPDATCIEVSLAKDDVRVPSQYGRLFRCLFDSTVHILSSDLEKDVFLFVESLPGVISLDTVKDNLGSLSLEVKAGVASAVDEILSTQRKVSAELVDYWSREHLVPRGVVSYKNDEAISIKLGIKQLSLINFPINLKDVANGRSRLKSQFSVDKDYLISIGACTHVGKGVAGWEIVFSTNVVVAAQALIKAGVTLKNGWQLAYLISPGAKRLFSDILDVVGTAKRHEELSRVLNQLSSSEELCCKFITDYESDEARCDLIDLAIRASGYTQNELSGDVQQVLGLSISQRNPVWFVVAKDDDAEEIVCGVHRFLRAAASLIWDRSGGRFSTVPWREFFESRVGTYYAHRSVQMEFLLLDAYIGSSKKEKRRSRPSALPRVLGLPTRFHMSVQGAAVCSTHTGETLFVTTISTPDKQHHKHKEFSGKARAIRYDWKGGALSQDVLRLLTIVDGNWSDSQIGMLANAGWNVCGWNEFSELVNDAGGLFGNGID